MKKSTLLLLMASTTGILTAAPRTLSQAQAYAQQFLSQKTGRTVELSCLNRQISAPGLSADAVLQPYYAFNDEQNQSFVIVSGSDLMRPVVGYSNSHTLPPLSEQLPDNMRSWFQWLNEAYQYVEQHPEAALTAAQTAQQFEPIEPMMKSKWGQDDPFNALCPTNCPVGCAATAASQVFRYHFEKLGQVVQGSGSHSYQYKNKTYSVNYSQQTYDYTLMPLKGKNATPEECDELAKLSYHVAVGLDMQFAPEGSGTSGCLVPRVATDHFGLNSLTSFISRELFSYDEWIQILYNELQHERPIFFGGQSSEGGHAFVLEGIDQNGLYYVNWGWDGYCDGYFDVTVLNSGGAGTGATVSEDGFCMDQSAVVNICYNEGEGHYYTPLQIGKYSFTTSKTTVNKGGSVTITAYNILNYSGKVEKGYIGLVLMQGDQEIARTNSTTLVSAEACERYMLYGTGQIQRKFTFDQDLPDGDYQLWMYYQPKGKDYSDYIRARHTNQSYFTVKVSGNEVKVSRPKLGAPVVPTSWSWETEQIETRPTTITCQLHNTGDESFVAQYLLTLYDPDGKGTDPINNGQVVVIAPGETKEVSFNYNFTKVGQWDAYLDFIRQNVSQDVEPLDDQTHSFNVVLNETQGAVFQLTEAPEQVSDTIYLNRPATFRLKLQNLGAPYNGQMGIRFFKSTSASNHTGEFFCPATFNADANGTIELTGDITGVKEKTVYYARAFYLYGEEYAQMNAISGVNNSLKVRIYPEPTSGIHDVMADDAAPDLQHSLIYDLHGHIITLPADAQLPRGIYIVNGKKVEIR